MPLGIVNQHRLVIHHITKRRHPRSQSLGVLVRAHGVACVSDVVLGTEVGEGAALEEVQVESVRIGAVDIGEDGVEVDDFRVELEVCVEGQDGGAEVVRAGLDPGGVEVAHLGEDLVDVDHESGDLVEAGFVAGGEIFGEDGEFEAEIHGGGHGGVGGRCGVSVATGKARDERVGYVGTFIKVWSLSRPVGPRGRLSAPQSMCQKHCTLDFW